MANVVSVSGMFGRVNGQIHTYFSDSPVVIDISGLYWGDPVTSPFTVVRVEVLYNDSVVGYFRQDTGGQTSISLDISSALKAIWASYSFVDEVADAQGAANGATAGETWVRAYATYYLRIFTEYISSDGILTTTICQDSAGNTKIPGGQCVMGGLTEMERAAITDKADADVSHLNGTNPYNGDASTKPTSSPERVGRDSITSWVDVTPVGTMSLFFAAEADAGTPHLPPVLRDSAAYTDFIFVNRRGAVETCSGLMFESMNINVSSQQYACVERPKFIPSRSLVNIHGGGPRRSWEMSSGYVSREWAEWWTMEFLQARQWWMRYPTGAAAGTYVPVVVEPAAKSITIYDRSKQQMPHVDFTVTLALEG